MTVVPAGHAPTTGASRYSAIPPDRVLDEPAAARFEGAERRRQDALRW